MTEKDWEKAIEAYEGGMGYQRVAKEIFGGKISRKIVRKELCRRGVEIRHYTDRKMGAEDWQIAIEKYEDGVTLREIAEKILGGKVSWDTIRAGLIKRGVQMRSCIDRKTRERDWQKAVKKYEIGYSLKDVTKDIFGGSISSQVVKTGLKKRGVKIRRYGTRKISEDEKKKIIRLYKEGHDAGNIAKALFRGKKTQAVRDIINGSRIKKRVRNSPCKTTDLPLFSSENPVIRNLTQDRKTRWKFKQYQENSSFRSMYVVQSRLNKFAKKENRKSSSAELIGCSADELRDHLESQFEDWMTWDNHGRDGWHIDHIVPCSWFDHTDEGHLQLCWNYRNLRPLGAKENVNRKDSGDDALEVLQGLEPHPVVDELMNFYLSKRPVL